MNLQRSMYTSSKMKKVPRGNYWYAFFDDFSIFFSKRAFHASMVSVLKVLADFFTIKYIRYLQFMIIISILYLKKRAEKLKI